MSGSTVTGTWINILPRLAELINLHIAHRREAQIEIQEFQAPDALPGGYVKHVSSGQNKQGLALGPQLHIIIGSKVASKANTTFLEKSIPQLFTLVSEIKHIHSFETQFNKYLALC